MPTQPAASARKGRTDRDDERPAGGQRLAAYNSVWQLRVDLWWSIADASRAVALPALDDATRTELAAVLARELANVESLENYARLPRASAGGPGRATWPTAPTARSAGRPRPSGAAWWATPRSRAGGCWSAGARTTTPTRPSPRPRRTAPARACIRRARMSPSRAQDRCAQRALSQGPRRARRDVRGDTPQAHARARRREPR